MGVRREEGALREILLGAVALQIQGGTKREVTRREKERERKRGEEVGPVHMGNERKEKENRVHERIFK